MSNTEPCPKPSHQVLTYDLLGMKKDTGSTLPQIFLLCIIFTSGDAGIIVEGNLCRHLNDQILF